MTLNLEQEVEHLFKAKMFEFFDWCEANWAVREDSKDEWIEDKSSDYREGYNASIEGLKLAYEVWAEEFYP